MHEIIDSFRKGSVFIIAEIGANHEGSVDEAKMLLDAAAKTGVDAVKFQTYFADKIVHKSQKDRHKHFRNLELTEDDFLGLAEYAERLGITFMSTPFDPDSVDFLDPLVPAFKIASSDITFLQLIKKVAEKGKPILMSTGMSTMDEIRNAVNVINNVNPKILTDGKVVLLHCTTSYPTDIKEANLNSIPFLKKEFNLPVGYSDHTIGLLASLASVVLGASVVEKHFTLDKNRSDRPPYFRDHRLSADVEDMKKLVKDIRALERGLGTFKKDVLTSEAGNLQSSRRCIVAKNDIKQGSVISEDSITALRPCTEGISAHEFFNVIGKKTKRDIKTGEIVFEKDLM
jgi:sialic acid synthase SpsE